MHIIQLENSEIEQTPMALIKIQKNKPNVGIVIALRNLVNIRSYFLTSKYPLSLPGRGMLFLPLLTNGLFKHRCPQAKLPLPPSPTNHKRKINSLIQGN